MSWTEVEEMVSGRNYAPKKRTLERLVASISSGQSPLSDAKASGAQPKLSKEQWMIVFGWVLNREEIVCFEHVRRWIKLNFLIEVSDPTVSRWMKKMGLSVQLVGARGLTPGVTWDEHVTGYFDFCKQLRDTGFFDYDPKKILCLDFVTDSRRRERDSTIGIIGGKQRKKSGNAPKYTNSYLVAVDMEGHIYDVLMFTFDPTFDPNGAGWEEVCEWCRANGIRTDQIFYEKFSRKYCKEDSSQVLAFLHRNRMRLRGTRILHDGGGAFKKDKRFILAEEADRIERLPKEQHGELSVLDNKLNGVAKSLWRQQRHNGNFAWDAFVLLTRLQSVDRSSIVSWWRQNFMLDLPEMLRNLVGERLKFKDGDLPIRQHLADTYVEAYHEWREDNDEKDLCYEGDTPLGGLNGPYWSSE